MTLQASPATPVSDNAVVKAALLRRVSASAPPWRRWRITTPRERWPVLALQLALFFSMFGLSAGGSYGGEGSTTRQVFWVMLFALSLLGVTASPQHLARITTVISSWRWYIALLLIFWLYATASSLWGEFPAVTAKRGVLLGLVLVLCVLAAATAVVLQIQLAVVVLPPLLALLFVSIAFSAFFPGIAFSPIGWQGMTGHKNIAGQLAAILVLCALLVRTEGLLGRTWVRWLVVVLALAALGLSRSATSLVCLLASLSLLGMMRLPALGRQHASWLIPIALVSLALLVVCWLLFILDALPSYTTLSSWGLDALGKSDTLTGRTKLWDLVLAQDRYRSIWFGLGYGGFWDSSYEQILYVIQRLGFRPIQAHNGFLDIFNELGLVGLALAMSIVIAAIVRITKALWGGGALRNTLLASALLAFIVVSNLAESSLLRSTNLLNLLFLTATLMGASRVGEAAMRRPLSSPSN